MNFGQLDIHELDKNRSYICEARITKQIPLDKLYVYFSTLRYCFKEAGITDIVIIPTGELNIKERDDNYG